MIKYLTITLGALLLAGCSQLTQVGLTAETPEQKMFQVETIYAGTLAFALQYESLPRCSDTQAQPCSDTDVVEKIRASDKAAFASLQSAEGIVRSPDILNGVLKADTAEAALQTALSFRALLSEFNIIGEAS